MARTHPKYWG